MSRRTGQRGHLGEIAAALVDGELGHQDREAALAHLAHCDGCRAEVDEHRRIKARLSGLPRPQVREELTARLRSIATTDAGGRANYQPWAGHRGPPTAQGPRRPAGRRPAGRRPAGRIRRSSRRWVAATGAAAVVAMALGTAFVAGGTAPSGRPVLPAVDQYAVEHAATTGSVSFPEPAVGAAVSASCAGSTAP